jgi:hypothetical protein
MKNKMASFLVLMLLGSMSVYAGEEHSHGNGGSGNGYDDNDDEELVADRGGRSLYDQFHNNDYPVFNRGSGWYHTGETYDYYAPEHEYYYNSYPSEYYYQNQNQYQYYQR